MAGGRRSRAITATDEVDRLSLNGARVGGSGYYDRYGAMANLMFDFDLSSFGIAPRPTSPISVSAAAMSGTRSATPASPSPAAATGSRTPTIRLPGHPRLGLRPRQPGAGPVGDGGIPLPRHARPEVHHQPHQRPGRPRRAPHFEPTNYNHSVLLGLRYSFNPPPATAAGRRPRRGARAGPDLPGLLRLGPGRPDSPRPAHHRRRRAEPPAGATDADRGRRPCRPLRHPAIQPAPVAAPRRCGGDRTGEAGHRQKEIIVTALARASRWCRRRTACGSRRTAGSRSFSGKRKIEGRGTLPSPPHLFFS